MHKISSSAVREARLDLGLTQARAAQVIGASVRSWQDWEAGRRNMPRAKFTLFLLLTQRSR